MNFLRTSAALLLCAAALAHSAPVRACRPAPSIRNTPLAFGSEVPSNTSLFVYSTATVCDASPDAFELIESESGDVIPLRWAGREVRNTSFLSIPTTLTIFEATPAEPLAAGEYTLRADQFGSGCDRASGTVESHFVVMDETDDAAPSAPEVNAVSPSCFFEEVGTSCDSGPFPRWRQRVDIDFASEDASFYEVTVDGELEYFGSDARFQLNRLSDSTVVNVEIVAVDAAGNRSELTEVGINEVCGMEGPRCGDGSIDDGEMCDGGGRNSDTRPDACRTDCTSARCGDGVVDTGELCDGGEDCPDDCGAGGGEDAGVGDGGMDGGSDAGADGGEDAGIEDAGFQDGGEADAGEADAGEADAGETDAGVTEPPTDEGCGCVAAGASRSNDTLPALGLLGLGALVVFRRRRR